MNQCAALLQQLLWLLLLSSALAVPTCTQTDKTQQQFCDDSRTSSSCTENFGDVSVQQALDAAADSNVFFSHTTSEPDLGTVQTCAAISAASQNPTRRINVFTRSLDCSSSLGKAKRDLPNLHIVRIDYRDLFAPYPELLSWYDSRVWDNQFRGAAVSNAVRLAATHRYGGAYMDTDFLSIRPLPTGINFIGSEDPDILNSAAMQWRKGHPFLLHAMHRFASEYIPDRWGWNGPRCIMRSYKSFHTMDGTDSDIMLAPIHVLYPLSWRDFSRLAEPYDSASSQGFLQAVLDGATLVHTWDHLSSKLLAESANSDQELTIHRLISTACPAREPSPVSSSGTDVSGLYSELETSSVGPGDCAGTRRFYDANAVNMASIDDIVPVQLHAGGRAMVSCAGTAASMSQARSSTPTDTPCGLFCNALAATKPTVFYTRYIMGGFKTSTLAFWISTVSSVWTSRASAHDMPATYDPLSKPDRRLDIPDSEAWVPDVGGAETVIIALEYGYLTVGSAQRERLRTESTVHDGRWHHVVVTVGPGRLELYLDGLMHAATNDMDFSQANSVAYLIGDARVPRRLPPLYLDIVALYDHVLAPAQVIRLRNTQQQLAVAAACRPSMPRWTAHRSDREAAQRHSLPLIVVVGDGSADDAAFRTAVRSTWLRLLEVEVARLVFAVWADHSEATRYERASFKDMVYVTAPASAGTRAGLLSSALFRQLVQDSWLPRTAKTSADPDGDATSVPPVIVIHQSVMPDLTSLSSVIKAAAFGAGSWRARLWQGTVVHPQPAVHVVAGPSDYELPVTTSAALFLLSGDLALQLSRLSPSDVDGEGTEDRPDRWTDVVQGGAAAARLAAMVRAAFPVTASPTPRHEPLFSAQDGCTSSGSAVYVSTWLELTAAFEGVDVACNASRTEPTFGRPCAGVLGSGCVYHSDGLRPAGYLPLGTSPALRPLAGSDTVKLLTDASSLRKKAKADVRVLDMAQDGAVAELPGCGNDAIPCARKHWTFRPRGLSTASKLTHWLLRVCPLEHCATVLASQLEERLLVFAAELRVHGDDTSVMCASAVGQRFCGFVVTAILADGETVSVPVHINPWVAVQRAVLPLPSAYVEAVSVTLLHSPLRADAAQADVSPVHVEDTGVGILIRTKAADHELRGTQTITKGDSPHGSIGAGMQAHTEARALLSARSAALCDGSGAPYVSTGASALWLIPVTLCAVALAWCTVAWCMVACVRRCARPARESSVLCSWPALRLVALRAWMAMWLVARGDSRTGHSRTV